MSKKINTDLGLELFLFLLRSLTPLPPPPPIPSPRSLPPPPPLIPHSSSSSSARDSPHPKLFPSNMGNRWELPIIIPAPSEFPSEKHRGATSHSTTTRCTVSSPCVAALWCSSLAAHLSSLATTSPTVVAIGMLWITFPKYNGSTHGTTRCRQFTAIRNVVVASDWRCFRACIIDGHSRAHSDWKDEISSVTTATAAVIAFFGSWICFPYISSIESWVQVLALYLDTTVTVAEEEEEEEEGDLYMVTAGDRSGWRERMVREAVAAGEFGKEERYGAILTCLSPLLLLSLFAGKRLMIAVRHMKRD